MPKGVYLRTVFYKKRLSLSKQGNKNPMWKKTPNEKQIEGLKRGWKIVKGKNYLQKLRKRMKGNKFGFKKGISSWNKGKHLSKKTRERMSESHKGKRLSEKTRKKMSKAQKRRVKEGRNSFWKGGISSKNILIRNSIEFRLWREAVFARDNYTCQKCLERGKNLHPHHIKNFAQYPELRFAINNGITFCKKCHDKFHGMYGRRGNTKEQVEKFLKKDVIIKVI